MNLKKIAPWNWFKHEDADDSHHAPARHELARYEGGNPLAPLTSLHQQIDRLFDHFGSGNWLSDKPRGGDPFEGAGLFRPSVNISENKNRYKIKVEVPGIEKDDIHVDLEDDRLVVRGEKKYEHEEEGENFHRIEHSYGSFRRVLDLPPDADSTGVKAKFRNGVLTLILPRSEALPSSGTRIEIETD